MPFVYSRTIRFQDTDAAGVVYFANVLAMCHEAYEASLAASGIHLQTFFRNPVVALPIVHASVDFFRPLLCGDRQVIQLIPKPLTVNQFETTYQFFPAEVPEQLVAQALIRHVCIDPASRTRTAIPGEIQEWLRQWCIP
ncbi:MAG TPA: thioesterase family protein [Candidatus Caenarcaniphilales bacterium]|jgi:1,4-dihydroxy-2-naphthoyl-CoA hydrolase